MRLDQKILRFVESQPEPIEHENIEANFPYADYLSLGEAVQTLLLAGLIIHDEESGGYIAAEKLQD